MARSGESDGEAMGRASMSDYEKDIRIVIDKMPNSNEWSWSVTVDGKEWYGYESDYLNAEGEMHDKLNEMGVDA